jgi:hypothetical protein
LWWLSSWEGPASSAELEFIGGHHPDLSFQRNHPGIARRATHILHFVKSELVNLATGDRASISYRRAGKKV